MGGHYDALRARLQEAEFFERRDLFDLLWEVEQEDVFSADRPFDAWNDDDAAVPRVVADSVRIQLLVVKGDCQDAIVELRGSIDEGKSIVTNGVLRVV